MSLDLRPDTTTLATTMLRGDQKAVPFWVDPAVDFSEWFCQVRPYPNGETISTTWIISPSPLTWAGLTDAKKAALTAQGADATFIPVQILFDARHIDVGDYAWDVQDGTPGNTVFGSTLTVTGDVTR